MLRRRLVVVVILVARTRKMVFFLVLYKIFTTGCSELEEELKQT